jgi:hypothetical protein
MLFVFIMNAALATAAANINPTTAAIALFLTESGRRWAEAEVMHRAARCTSQSC